MVEKGHRMDLADSKPVEFEVVCQSEAFGAWNAPYVDVLCTGNSGLKIIFVCIIV